MSENTSSEIKTPIGSISFAGKRVAEFIAVLSLSLMGILAYAHWEHKGDTKTHQEEMRDTLKEVAQGIRENNCLTTFKEGDREAKSEFCKRVSR